MLKIDRLFKLSIAFNLGLILVAFSGVGLIFFSVLVCLLFCFGILLFRKQVNFKIFLGLVIAFAVGTICFLINDFNFHREALKLANSSAKVHAKIVDVKTFPGEASSYLLKIDQIEGEKRFFPIYASLTSGKRFKFNYGDKIEADIKFSYKNDINNNFGFNFAKSRNIYLRGKILKLFRTVEDDGIFTNFFKARNGLVKAIDCAIGEPANFLASSIFLGKTAKMPYSLQRCFDRCGLSHIFAVSGLHISILFAILLYVLSFFKIPNKLSFLILCFFLLCYNFLLGFCISAIRASLMDLAYFFGTIFKKKINSVHLLCLTASVILFFAPSSIFSCSFVLSFSSCLGILLFFKPISKFIKRKFLAFSGWQKYIIDLISVSVSAVIFSSIFLTIFFGKISLMAPIVNLIVMPFIPIILMFTGLTATSGYLGFFDISSFFGYFCEGIFNEIILLVEFVSNLPFCCIPMRYFFAPIVVIGLIGFLVFVFFYARFAFFSKIVAFLCCLIILVPIINNAVIASGASCISVIGNRSGYSIVINSSDKVIVLNCGGNNNCDEKLCNFLDSRGIKTIDFLIFLSNDTRCKNCNITTIVECFKTFCVMMPYRIDNEYLVGELAEKETNLIFAEQAHFDNFPIAIDFIKRIKGEGFNCYLTIGGISFAYCFSEEEALNIQRQRFSNVLFLDDKIGEELDGCGFLIMLKPCVIDSKKAVAVSPNEITEFTIHGSYLKQEGY